VIIAHLTGTPECKIFFTTDGSKPNHMQPKVGGRETTFRYRGPFTMSSGKRTLKVIAVARYVGLEHSIYFIGVVVQLVIRNCNNKKHSMKICNVIDHHKDLRKNMWYYRNALRKSKRPPGIEC